MDTKDDEVYDDLSEDDQNTSEPNLGYIGDIYVNSSNFEPSINGAEEEYVNHNAPIPNPHFSAAKSKYIVNIENPIIYYWFGILILVGAILIFCTEIALIFQDCYESGSTKFYIGSWVSWFLIICAVLQIRIAKHPKEIDILFLAFTLTITIFSCLLLFSGFILALIMRVANINRVCQNIIVVTICEISLTLVPVIWSVLYNLKYILFEYLPARK